MGFEIRGHIPMTSLMIVLLAPQQYVVLLCDTNGVAIHHRGDEPLANAYKDCGIWLGGVWSEQIEGTNGIGTCVTEQRATTVLQRLHPDDQPGSGN